MPAAPSPVGFRQWLPTWDCCLKVLASLSLKRTKSLSWKAPSKDIESNGNSQIRNRNGSLSAQCHLVGSIKLLPFNFQHLSFIVCFMLPARQIAQPLCFDSCMCLVFRACSDRLGPTLSQILPFVQKEKCVLVVFCCVLTSDSCDSMKRLPAKLDPGSQLQRYSMLVSVNESVWHLQNERYHNLILFHPYLCNSVTYPSLHLFSNPGFGCPITCFFTFHLRWQGSGKSHRNSSLEFGEFIADHRWLVWHRVAQHITFSARALRPDASCHGCRGFPASFGDELVA